MFWRRIAAHFAFLAIAIQVLAIQPHLEPAAVGAFNHEVSGGQAIAVAQTQKASTACIICQAAIGSRNAVTPSSLPATFQREALALATPLPAAPALSATPSHTWRSRAPPASI